MLPDTVRGWYMVMHDMCYELTLARSHAPSVLPSFRQRRLGDAAPRRGHSGWRCLPCRYMRDRSSGTLENGNGRQAGDRSSSQDRARSIRARTFAPQAQSSLIWVSGSRTVLVDYFLGFRSSFCLLPVLRPRFRRLETNLTWVTGCSVSEKKRQVRDVVIVRKLARHGVQCFFSRSSRPEPKSSAKLLIRLELAPTARHALFKCMFQFEIDHDTSSAQVSPMVPACTQHWVKRRSEIRGGENAGVHAVANGKKGLRITHCNNIPCRLFPHY
jgi:hypothetical protein